MSVYEPAEPRKRDRYTHRPPTHAPTQSSRIRGSCASNPAPVSGRHTPRPLILPRSSAVHTAVSIVLLARGGARLTQKDALTILSLVTHRVYVPQASSSSSANPSSSRATA